MASKRQLQIAETIKRTMSEIFIENDLSIIDGNFVTITQAEISADGSSVKIFIDITPAKTSLDLEKISEISPQNSAKSSQKIPDFEGGIIAKLKKLTPTLRFNLAARTKLRITPEIKFLLDNTNQQISQISKLFQKS